MSNAKSDNRFIAALKVLLAPKAGKTEITAPITIVEYVEPPSEEDAVKAYLTKDQTDILEADKAAVKENEDDHKEAVKQAKIATAKAKLLADSAARVAKSTTMVSNALAKAEVAFLEELVETQNGLDRLATRAAAKDLVNARLEAMRNGRIHDMDIVAAHMAGDTDSAEQARQAAILLAGRNTSSSSKGDKSYSSNAGYGGAGDAEKKPAKRPVAFKALKVAGLSTEEANDVLDNTYSNKVDDFVKTQIAAGKQAFVAKVAAIMCGDEGAYANRWKAYVASASTNASDTTNAAPAAGAGIFAAPGQTTPAPKPTVTNGDPVNS